MKNTIPLRTLTLFTRILFVLMIAGAVVVFSNGHVFAQAKTFVELSKPDISSYPDLSVYFRVFEDTGIFTKNLDISAVHLVENDQVIAPDRLEMLEPGVRLILAVNEGPTLANHYAQVSRIDKIKTALTNWMQAQPITTMSDFSLITNSGVKATQLSNPSDWISTLQEYQPDLKQSEPGLSSLSSAIDLATNAVETSGKTSALLYVTPLPAEEQNPGLEDLLNRAKLGNVRMFIWLVGPQTYATDKQAALLQKAAEETGGEFLVFSGAEDLPDMAGYFNPLIYVYRAVYHSKIMSSGDFSVSLRVNKDDIVLESEPVIFTLNAQPPNPIFLSPPARVERTWTETEKISDSVLTPNTVPLEIMIEFPDGLKRELVYSRLFVDDQLVDENTSPPFEKFEWDISKLMDSGSHKLSVSIEDTAGFIIQTLELPVELNVQPKPKTWMQKILSAFSAQTIALFFVITAAGILLISFAIRTLRMNRSRKRRDTHRLEDPLTQPVIIENEIIHPMLKSNTQDQWPQLPGSGLAPARLLLQTPAKPGLDLPTEIAVGGQTLTIGSDSKKSRIVLPSTSISGLHARIVSDSQDQFKVFDEGSGSGTWLNYAPVSQYGARLEHGDLVQFGTIAYRFEIYGSHPRKLKVETLKDDE